VKAIWDRFLYEPALIFTVIVTAYTAALAAGWSPADWVQIVAAVLVALGGVFGVRANVTPTRKL
jgi:hypothetical protein